MYGKKFYAFVLISMTLLAALGVWTIIDGAAAYRARPRMNDFAGRYEYQSQTIRPDADGMPV